MYLRTEELHETKLAGKRLNTSFANNRTYELWHDFMPRLAQIGNRADAYLYSVEIYPPGFLDSYNPTMEFEKWAAVAVHEQTALPDTMESLTIPAGSYAVFLHKGPASEGPKTYRYIFREWLPNSDYAVDNRPHFALMGEKYKNNDPDSEEEIWIPVIPGRL